MEPFVGEIRALPFSFVPRGWLACDGSQVPIQRFSPLFALLGTAYGGNGTTTFALPDLRGAAVLSAGQGPGLAPWNVGEKQGAEAVTIDQSTMPAHPHVLNAGPVGRSGGGVTPVEQGYLASPAGVVPPYASPSTGNLEAMAANALTSVGGGQAHENRQPFLAIQYCIAYEGIFPPRP